MLGGSGDIGARARVNQVDCAVGMQGHLRRDPRRGCIAVLRQQQCQLARDLPERHVVRSAGLDLLEWPELALICRQTSWRWLLRTWGELP